MLPTSLAALGTYRQFIAYLAVPSTARPGKTDKLPVDHRTGKRCNAHDPANWTDAATALAAAASFGTDHGVGFVLTADDPFFCLDIDGCLMPDKTWSPVALQMVNRFSGAVEVSMSGTGLHIWGKYTGAAPAHSCKNGKHGIELYTELRFIALGHPSATGDAGTDCTAALASVVSEFFPASTDPTCEPVEWSDCKTDPAEDAALIAKMLASKNVAATFGNRASFADLWNANEDALAATYPDKFGGRAYDASSADAALAMHLAWWTQNDCERIKRLMLQSALVRDKYDRPDYLTRTISNACGKQTSDGIGARTSHLNNAGDTNAPPTPPEQLPTLPDVLPFDYSYLPDALRGYVKDISERMQCPPDFAAVGVLVMMATIIGRKVGVRPMKHNDWTVIPNLWGAVVGNSGVMKSPTLAAALSPIKKLQAAAYDVFNKAKAEYVAQAEIAKLQQSLNKDEAKKALKGNKSADVKGLLQSGETDDAPILMRYITNNASYEALGELLMETPNGLMVEADEIIGLLKQLDASGQEVARSFYLTAADGDKSYTFDRIMRGKGLHIDAVCLSIIGGIQPGVLAEYVRQATGGGAGADGLLQRFGLMVYPDVSPNWKEVDRYPDSAARVAVNLLAERLDNLNHAEIGAEVDLYGGVPFLHFDDAAQVLFSEWRASLEIRLRSGEEHPAIVSHLSKYRKLIPSLALINHLCDSRRGAVSESALQRAIAFSEYLESHAQRIYSYATRPDIDAAKTLLKRLASGKLPDIFKAREIYLKGWAGLETPVKAQSAIDLLVEYHHLSEEEITTGGRPTTHYHWIKAGAL